MIQTLVYINLQVSVGGICEVLPRLKAYTKPAKSGPVPLVTAERLPHRLARDHGPVLVVPHHLVMSSLILPDPQSQGRQASQPQAGPAL